MNIILNVAIKTLNSLINLIGNKNVNIDSARSGVDQYNRIKAQIGSPGILKILALKDNELPFFEASLRDIGRRIDIKSDTGENNIRNAEISALRFISWIETINSNGINVEIPSKIKATINDDVGRKQIRALELIIRNVINERFGSQETLEKELNSLLNSEIVSKWKQSSDQGDILSGTTFSELASLYVNKQEFTNYSKLYIETSFLNFLRDKRKTIQNFLEDIRRSRNTLAHNKNISNTQLSLIDLYYEELISPLQDAFDNGETDVNPSQFIDASNEELNNYFTNLKEDIADVKDDIAEFRSSVENKLGIISKDTSDIKNTTKQVKKQTQFIIAGVILLLIGLGTTFYFVSGTKKDTAEIKNDTKEIKALNKKTDKTVESIKEITKETSDGIKDIKSTISDMAEGVKSLAKTGGLVTQPSVPSEYYHNARMLTQRGEIDRGIDQYKELFKFDFIAAEPIIDFVSILRQKYGEENLVNIIDNFISPSKKISNSYAKLLVTKPSSKDLKFWLSNKPLFLPAVPEIVKHSSNQSFNLTRYMLQTDLEKMFMDSSLDRARYYIDPVRADNEFQKVKNSYEKTNWETYNNYKKAPLFFYTQGSPNIGTGQVNFSPMLLDELGINSNDKYQIRIRATGDYKKLMKISNNNLSEWNDFNNNNTSLKFKKYYGYFKTIPFSKELFPNNLFFPYISDLPQDQKFQHICASWLYKGELKFDVKWIDNENIERLSENINLCPTFIKKPNLLKMNIIDLKHNQNNKNVQLSIQDIIPIYKPSAKINMIKKIEVMNASGSNIIELLTPEMKKTNNFKFDAKNMSNLRNCRTVNQCEVAEQFKNLIFSFDTDFDQIKIKFTISYFGRSFKNLNDDTVYMSNIINLKNN